jgi:hypothetical protein
MVLRRAWLGSVGVIVISRKLEYSRRSANARGLFDNKYLLRYSAAELGQVLPRFHRWEVLGIAYFPGAVNLCQGPLREPAAFLTKPLDMSGAGGMLGPSR